MICGVGFSRVPTEPRIKPILSVPKKDVARICYLKVVSKRTFYGVISLAVTTENSIAKAVLKIAARQPNGVASFGRRRREIPSEIKLTADDLSPSTTRNGEPMWHQIVRNIKCHHEASGNYINSGYLEHVPRVAYKITSLGRKKI